VVSYVSAEGPTSVTLPRAFDDEAGELLAFDPALELLCVHRSAEGLLVRHAVARQRTL
jgi:hypothetical protein